MSDTKFPHLGDLIERVLIHHREQEEAFDNAVRQRALELALNDPNLNTDQKQLLEQIRQKKMQALDLLTHDEPLYYRLFREYGAEARNQLNEERAAEFKEKWGPAWIEKWTEPWSPWDYVAEQIGQYCQVGLDQGERFADLLEKYCQARKEHRLADSDERIKIIANEIARLDSEGFTNQLIKDIWDKYPDEATQMSLISTGEPSAPDSPPVEKGTTKTISKSQAAQLYAEIAETKPDISNINKMITSGKIETNKNGLPTFGSVFDNAVRIKESKQPKTTTTDTDSQTGTMPKCKECGKETGNLFHGWCRACACIYFDPES